MLQSVFKELKRSTALTLALFLLLSCFSGVMQLSASAEGEENVFPVVKNEPVMYYRIDECYYNEGKGNYCFNCHGIFETINILIDDDEVAKYSASIIYEMKYKFSLPDGSEFVSNASSYSYLHDFDTLLVNIGDISESSYDYMNLLEFIMGKKVSKSYEYYDYSYNDYLHFLNVMSQAKLELYITWGMDVENDTQVIPIKIEEEKNTGFIDVNTVGAVLLQFAHSKNINSDSFYELDNAIFAERSVNKDTTNKYYVDIESEDNIVLPMDNMSSRLNLEQTRIGSNVVYNTGYALDFEDRAVGLENNGVSDGKADLVRCFKWDMNGETAYATSKYGDKISDGLSYAKYGNVYYNGGYIEYDGKMVYIQDYDYAYGDNSYYYDDNGQRIYLRDDSNTDYVDIIDRGYVLTGGYTGLPGTEFDQDLIDQITNNKTPFSSFFIKFNDSDSVKGKENIRSFIMALKSFYESDTISQQLKNVLYNTSLILHIDCSYNETQGRYTKTYKNGIDFSIRDRYTVNVPSSTFKRIIAFLDRDEYLYDNRLYNNFQWNELSYIQFSGISLNEIADIPEICEELVGFINNWNQNVISENESYMPDIRLAKRTLIKEALNAVECEEPLKYPVYKRSYDEVYFQRGKTAFNTTGNRIKDNNPVVIDTYKNDSITVNRKDLVEIEKGISYNVVNQVSTGSIQPNSYYYKQFESIRLSSNFYNTFSNLEDFDRAIESESNKDILSNIFYANGEFITNYDCSYIEHEYNQYHNTINSYYDKLNVGLFSRHTEYKWGELVFASRPDPVRYLDINYDNDEDSYVITWTKPIDEGFGVDVSETYSPESPDTPVMTETTRVDDGGIVYVETYTITIKDDEGNVIYTDVITRDPNNDDVKVVIPFGELPEDNNNYTVEVYCTNVLGDSDIREVTIGADVEIVMTPDKPVYRDTETVTYTETVTNTGDVPLTNVVVTQDLPGTYPEQDGVTPIDGTTSAHIPDLEPGESFTFTYVVKVEDYIESINQDQPETMDNAARVETAQKVTDDDQCTVEIIYPDISIIKEVDRHDYHIGDEVVWIDTVTNTGDYTLTNIVITETLDGTFIIDTDYDTTENTMIIPILEPGDSYTYKFVTVIDEENVSSDDIYPCEVTAEAAEGVSDDDAKDVPVVYESDTDTESDTESTSDVTDSEPDSDTDSVKDTKDSDSETDTGIISDSDTTSDVTDTEPESDTESTSDATDSEPESDSDSTSDVTDTEPESDTDSVKDAVDSDSETDTGFISDTDTVNDTTDSNTTDSEKKKDSDTDTNKPSNPSTPNTPNTPHTTPVQTIQTTEPMKTGDGRTFLTIGLLSVELAVVALMLKKRKENICKNTK